MVPTFTVYPEDGVTDAVAAALARGGAVCKVHDQLSGFALDDPRLDDAWRLCGRANTLVVAHTSKVYGVDGGEATSGPEQIHRVRAKHPDLRLCIAHLGLPDPDGGHWDAIAQLDKVWTDPSGVLVEPPHRSHPGAWWIAPGYATGCRHLCSAATSPRSRTRSPRRSVGSHTSSWYLPACARSCTTVARRCSQTRAGHYRGQARSSRR